MFFDKDYNLLHEVGCDYGKDPLNNWYESLHTYEPNGFCTLSDILFNSNE